MQMLVTKKSNLGGARLSNFELLRLLCMLMVLNLHSFWGWQHGTGIWQAVDFFRESTSICAVDCFVLISGYFGIKWKFNSLFNLFFQLFFYSIGVYLVAVACGVVGWDLKSFLMRFACLSTDSWGFVVSYVILYFCSPVLNIFAERHSAKMLFVYIIVFVLALNLISFTASSAFTYSVVYLIGRLLRKINIESVKMPATLLYWITTATIFIIVYFVLFKMFHISSAEIVGKRPVGSIGYDYAAPLVILQAVTLFSIFAKIKIECKIINWCARSAFAVFLIHMHPTIKQIGYLSFAQGLYEYPVLKHIFILVILIVSVFVGSIIIDRFRIFISSICYYVIEKIYGFIPTKYRLWDTYLSDK